jgi:DNA (cytosine-5)-methyltransferase 1
MSGKYCLFSLFSGAGGLDLGFELSGRFETVFGNDIFIPAVETFSSNFRVKLIKSSPRANNLPSVFLGDVAVLQPENFKGLQPDVVTGGPPCQDFSIVRGPQEERGGIKVSRGRLYSHYIRALIHLQPKVFVFENVPGLMSTNKGKAYEVILRDFSELNVRWEEIRKLVNNSSSVSPTGYEIVFHNLVDASKLGVPQARKRLVIIGVRKDLFDSSLWKVKELTDKITNILDGGNRRISRYPLTTMEVLEGKTLPDLDSKYAEVMEAYKGVADEVGTPKAMKWKEKVWEKLSFDSVEDYVMLNKIKLNSSGELDEAFREHAEILKELEYLGSNVSNLTCSDGSNEIPKESKRVQERMKRIPPDENHEFVRGTEWEVEGRGISLIYRRSHPLKPAYTIVAYGGGGTWGYHYERRRGKLTHRERARLQTFPDWFVFKGNSSQVRAQLGEAVPPLMAKRIAEAVATVLNEFN